VPFVFTNDDAGSNDVRLFHEVLDFLKRRGIRATFFVIPQARGTRLGERPEWIRGLRRALGEGHEIGLHGFEHGEFEFGHPPDAALLLGDGRSWETLRNRRDELYAQWQVDVLAERLERGLEILEQDLGIRPGVFRSGWCAVCPALYQALSQVGLRHDSSLFINNQGHAYCAKNFTAKLGWEAYPPRPFPYLFGVVEFPIMADYTWFLRDELEAEACFELARVDYERVLALGGVFTGLSHFFAMAGPHALGLRLYDRLLDYAESRGPVRFCTIGELAGEVERGSMPLAW